jgi:hypothetical protein
VNLDTQQCTTKETELVIHAEENKQKITRLREVQKKFNAFEAQELGYDLWLFHETYYRMNSHFTVLTFTLFAYCIFHRSHAGLHAGIFLVNSCGKDLPTREFCRYKTCPLEQRSSPNHCHAKLSSLLHEERRVVEPFVSGSKTVVP